jgi:hypothetical protein
MIKGRAFIYLIITLLIGFALGLFSDGLHHVKKGRKFNNMGPGFHMGDMLARDLQLTESQVKQTKDIFDKYEKKAKQRRKEIREEVERDVDSLKTEIIPYLTKEQVQRLESLFERGPGPLPGLGPGGLEPGMPQPPPGQGPPHPGEGNPPWDRDAPPPDQGVPPPK